MRHAARDRVDDAVIGDEHELAFAIAANSDNVGRHGWPGHSWRTYKRCR